MIAIKFNLSIVFIDLPTCVILSLKNFFYFFIKGINTPPQDTNRL